MVSTYEFPNFNPTVDGKDGENYSKGGKTKAICPVNNIFTRLKSGSIVSAISTFTKDNPILINNWSVCILIDSYPSTLEFPNMNATTNGKDGENITQAQAETQDTYVGWNFTTIWYMGSKYPLLR